MLEEFIQSNNLQAKIVPLPLKLPAIKCRLFRCGSFDVLAICFASNKIDSKKIAAAVGAKEAKPIAWAEAEGITGYEAEFMPPISIYGAKAVVDSKLAKVEKVKCPVNPEQVLEINPKEILEANEDAIEANITL